MYILDKCIEHFYSWTFADIILLLSVIHLSQLFPFIGLCYIAALFNRHKNVTMNNLIICFVFHLKKKATSSYFLSLFPSSMNFSIKKPNQKLYFIFYITLHLYYTNTSTIIASVFACYFNGTVKSQAFLLVVYRLLNVASKVLAI